ncbi:6992_t:CDS:1 [Ambispora leptoticha]|uniref:6992_t:CDS:1 n=1 Tax=Ambispora leptoticha TaxID=144679 RepID=A0A9N8ZY54_9GLOM|nr:6992_t:CDS:1 [Ambispora leptoticha]
MKVVIIPLKELDAPGCNYFQPSHAFNAEWCLDLHGFLNRDEFNTRLNEINDYIKKYPLLSEKAKNFLKSVCIGVAVLVGLFFILALRSVDYQVTPSIIVEVCNFIGYWVGKYWIERIAKRRAKEFTAALNSLFARYNIKQKENPTANWRLVWRSRLKHFSISMQTSKDGRSIKGRATPKYAEHAEIALEIHDALSDLTANTVRVNIAADAIS